MENVAVNKDVHQFYGGRVIEKGRSRSSVQLTDDSKMFAKRILDLGISVGVIVFVLSWLFPIVALGIKLTSKGPILFRQKRHGLNNKPFYCYKFRTMVLNSEADVRQATKGDSRITRIGRFLRVSSIDELPQIFNVLRGEMSIVGPRPHAMPMNVEFAAKIDNFMDRHQVKPGITGLAQAKGFRGEIRNFNDIYFRYRLDIFYIQKWCVLLDVWILIETIRAMLFKNSNAY